MRRKATARSSAKGYILATANLKSQIALFANPFIVRCVCFSCSGTGKDTTMKQIIKPNSGITKILGRAKQSGGGYRLLKYCVPVETEDGTLLFNLLTRELVLLDAREATDMLSLEELRRRWFVVPEDMNERELVEMVRWIRRSMRKPSGGTSGYTIFTTTACNARCYYCYEAGCNHVSMNRETAGKALAYIKNHCAGKKVQITWYGGEPLVNASVIDLISEGLHAAGVDYEAKMISNGYLFDDASVAKAVDLWNLKKVQITLDGTEEVYNRSKNYVYREGSAYRVVTANVERLLNAGVFVMIRMNVDLQNADDLMDLADELAHRFWGRDNLHVYCHLMFDARKDRDQRNSDREWELLYEKQCLLEEKISRLGLCTKKSQGLRRDLPVGYCMADNDNTVVIVPDGHLGTCDHHAEDEFIGHIDSEEKDRGVIASWKELRDEIPECADCFYYPECYVLKKCPDHNPCNAPSRKAQRLKTERAMVNEYRKWCASGGQETEDSEEQESEGC